MQGAGRDRLDRYSPVKATATFGMLSSLPPAVRPFPGHDFSAGLRRPHSLDVRGSTGGAIYPAYWVAFDPGGRQVWHEGEVRSKHEFLDRRTDVWPTVAALLEFLLVDVNEETILGCPPRPVVLRLVQYVSHNGQHEQAQYGGGSDPGQRVVGHVQLVARRSGFHVECLHGEISDGGVCWRLLQDAVVAAALGVSGFSYNGTSSGVRLVTRCFPVRGDGHDGYFSQATYVGEYFPLVKFHVMEVCSDVVVVGIRRSFAIL